MRPLKTVDNNADRVKIELHYDKISRTKQAHLAQYKTRITTNI